MLLALLTLALALSLSLGRVLVFVLVRQWRQGKLIELLKRALRAEVVSVCMVDFTLGHEVVLLDSNATRVGLHVLVRAL